MLLKAIIYQNIAMVMCHGIVTLLDSLNANLQVYKEGILKVSLNCATQAVKHGTKRFIEVSTGQVYSGDKVSLEK